MPAAPSDRAGAPPAEGPAAERRACLACRSIKVRCITQSADEQRCRRCTRLDLECTVPEHNRGVRGGVFGERKRPKKEERSRKKAKTENHATPSPFSSSSATPAGPAERPGSSVEAWTPASGASQPRPSLQPQQQHEPQQRQQQAQPHNPHHRYPSSENFSERHASDGNIHYSPWGGRMPENPSPAAPLLEQRSAAAAYPSPIFGSDGTYPTATTGQLPPHHANAQHRPSDPSQIHASATLAPMPPSPQLPLPSSARAIPSSLGSVSGAGKLPSQPAFSPGQQSVISHASVESAPSVGGHSSTSIHRSRGQETLSVSRLLNSDAESHQALRSAALGSHVGGHVGAGPSAPGDSHGRRQNSRSPSSDETFAFLPDLCPHYLTESEVKDLMTCYFTRLNPIIALVNTASDHQLRIRHRASHRFLLTAICTAAAKFILPHRYDALLSLARDGVSKLTNDAINTSLPNIQALSILAFYNEPQDGTAFRHIRLAILLSFELGLHNTASQLSHTVGPHIPDLADLQRTYMQLACFEAPLAVQRNLSPLIDRSKMLDPRAWLESLDGFRTDIDVRIASAFETTGIAIQLAQDLKQAAAELPSGSVSSGLRQARLLKAADATATETFSRWLNPLPGIPLPSGVPDCLFHRLNVHLNHQQALYLVFCQPAMSGPTFTKDRREAFETASRLVVEILALFVEGPYGEDSYFRFVHDQVILNVAACVVWVLEYYRSMEPDLAARAVELIRKANMMTQQYAHLTREPSSSLARFFEQSCERLPTNEAVVSHIGQQDIDSLGMTSDMQSIFFWVNNAAALQSGPPTYAPGSAAPNLDTGFGTLIDDSAPNHDAWFLHFLHPTIDANGFGSPGRRRSEVNTMPED